MTNDLRKCGEVAKKRENEGEGLLFCTVLEDEWRRMHSHKYLKYEVFKVPEY